MAQAEGDDRLGQLDGDGTRVDHRRVEVSGHVVRGLVHRGRAQQDDISAVLVDGELGLFGQSREDRVLLAAQQLLHVGS